MLFNSLHFLIFFPLVVITFFALPPRIRWLLLLVASYYFYMSWKPIYGLLLFVTTVIAYIAGIQIEKARDEKTKNMYLYGCIVFSLGILFFFKYFNFFFDTLAHFINVFDLSFTSPTLQILLPVGISFYIFQALSYVIDVYRGTCKAERHFGIFALYKSFFPQLVAGPIERASHMLPQLHKTTTPTRANFVIGLRLMLWGAFKKIVVADNAALIVSSVYDDPSGVNGIALLVGTLFFAVQIYGDFSGYSDIARGAARILGYDLVQNFNNPYFVRSITDFWNRWHISLTSWFQIYVFMPLYTRLIRTRALRSLPSYYQYTLTFIIATLIGLTLLGLWHGANVTFIAFGLSQATFIIMHHLIKKWWGSLNFYVANVLTLCMVLTGFVFFRASTLHDALTVFAGIFDEIRILIFSPFLLPTHALEAAYALGVNRYQLVLISAAAIFLFTAEALFQKESFQRWCARIPRPVRLGGYYALIVWILLQGNFGETSFIYFQF